MALQLQNQALCAKCRAMSAEFLTLEDYKALSKMTSVREIAAYLTSNTSYKDEFSGIDLQNINRLSLEHILHGSLYHTYKKLYNFSTGEIKDTISAMTRKFDIDILIRIFSQIRSGFDKVPLSDIQLEILEGAGVDTNAIIKATSTDKAKVALKGTSYYEPLVHSIVDGELNLKLFETKLYEMYYKDLYEKFELTSPTSGHNIIGIIADYENLERIYRFKFSFGTPAEQIFPYLIRVYGFLNENQLMKLCSLDYESFISQVRESPFGRKVTALNAHNETTDSHHSHFDIKNFFAKFHRKLFLNTEATAQIPFSYLSLKVLEAENIIHIIEGVRYRLPVNEIMKNIACY